VPRSPTGPGPRKSGPSTRIARLYPARHDCRCSARQYVGSAFCRQQAVPRSGCRNSARVRRPCPGWAQDSDLPRRPGRPYRRGMRLRGNAQATPRQPRSVTPSPCTPTAPQARAPDPAGRKNQGNPRAGSLPPDGQALAHVAFHRAACLFRCAISASGHLLQTAETGSIRGQLHRRPRSARPPPAVDVDDSASGQIRPVRPTSHLIGMVLL
jgi:hypothetical protein